MSSPSTQRELLMAENIGWWYDAWVGNLFQECPWKDPAFISFAAELNRDTNHQPASLVESWAPAGLIPVKMLIANDAESVLKDCVLSYDRNLKWELEARPIRQDR